jgi:hypothetical protein
MSDDEKQPASPFSTGGGGEKLQDLVGAYYLTALLLRQTPRGLESGTTNRVRFQRLYEGEPMDDLICDAVSASGHRKLALQLKNDVTVGEKSARFAEVIGACWRTFRASGFQPGSDRMGFGLGINQTVVSRHYQRVLHWARNSDSASSFLSRVKRPKLASEEMRAFVSLVRKKLDAANGSPVSDEDLWGFLRSLVMLDFDLLQVGSRDRAHALDCLQRMFPPGHAPGAAELFTCLKEVAGDAAIAAGEFDLTTLTRKLQELGFSVMPGVDCREDLEVLDAIGTSVLGDIRVDIGGVRLDRTALIEQPEGDARDASLLLLVGPPGVGKSGTWRGLVELHRLQGPSLVLSADRLEGKGWLGFAALRGIRRSLEQLLLAVGTHPMPCLFIDGLDRIEDEGARRVVNDLLRTANRVLTTATGVRRWWCVATSREGSLDRLKWLDRDAVRNVSTARVPELGEAERKHVASHHAQLWPLVTDQRLEPVMSNAFFLDLLTDRRFTGGTAAEFPSTEAALSDVWWERIVGLDGTADGKERQQSLIEAARRAIASPFRKFPDSGLPPTAMSSLEGDVVLRREAGRNVYRFAHDLLEDWSLIRLLDQHAHELPRFIVEAGEPSGMSRSVQLLGCWHFEREPTPDAWATLLGDIERNPSLAPRWRQAMLAAPLLSSRLEELLVKAADILLADEGRLLLDLLRHVRTSEIDVDPAMQRLARGLAKTPEEAVALAARFPVPRWRIWYGVLRWLLARAGSLPAPVLDESLRLMETWQEKSPPDTPLRREIGQLALQLLEKKLDEDTILGELFDGPTEDEDGLGDGPFELHDDVTDDEQKG